MKKYARVIDNETKQCEVGDGTNIDFYISIGMEKIEVEQSWDEKWYLVGYAPEKPVEIKQEEVRKVRNSYLETTDKYMIVDFPITDEERESYKTYRQYLRDYTAQEDWWENEPETYEEWLVAHHPVIDVESEAEV